MILQNAHEINKLNKDFEKLHSASASILNFDVISQISSGPTCKFYKVLLKSTKRPFTLKVAPKAKGASPQKLKDQVLREISTLSNLAPHRNILKLEAAFEDKAQIYLLFEPVETSLSILLKNGQKLSESDCRQYMRGLLRALSVLHNLNPPVIHRNIKPENIFISGEEAKLAGFEHAASGEEFRTTICGSSNYLSPEMINNDGYDEKVDIWSAGVVFYELLHGKNPFSGNSIAESCRLSQSLIDKAISQTKLSFDSQLAPEARRLMEEMLSQVPFQRPSTGEALDSEFLAQPKVNVQLNKDNSFTVHFEMIPSSRQIEESLNWSVTQSQIGRKGEVVDFGEIPSFQKEKRVEDKLFQTEVQAKARTSKNVNSHKPPEKSPFEILLEQHHKIVH